VLLGYLWRFEKESKERGKYNSNRLQLLSILQECSLVALKDTCHSAHAISLVSKAYARSDRDSEC
jgi:hypothetical protein